MYAEAVVDAFRKDQKPYGGAAQQVGNHGNMQSFGIHAILASRSEAVIDVVWIDQYTHRDAAAQAESQGNMQSFGTLPPMYASSVVLRPYTGHSGGRAVPASPASISDLRAFLDTNHQPATHLHHGSWTGSRVAYPVGSGQGIAIDPSGVNGPASAATGYTKDLRTPVRTRCCGKITAVPPRVPHTIYQRRSSYRLRCIICGEAFRDHRAVFKHFPVCVRERGNRTGACWFDHETIELDRIPETLIQKVRT